LIAGTFTSSGDCDHCDNSYTTGDSDDATTVAFQSAIFLIKN